MCSCVSPMVWANRPRPVVGQSVSPSAMCDWPPGASVAARRLCPSVLRGNAFLAVVLLLEIGDDAFQERDHALALRLRRGAPLLTAGALVRDLELEPGHRGRVVVGTSFRGVLMREHIPVVLSPNRNAGSFRSASIVSVMTCAPSLRAKAAGIASSKKSQTWAPRPDRDRSIAAGSDSPRHVSRNATASSRHPPLSKSTARRSTSRPATADRRRRRTAVHLGHGQTDATESRRR